MSQGRCKALVGGVSWRGPSVAKKSLRGAAALIFGALASVAVGCSSDDKTADTPTVSYPLDDVLRVNHLQAKGTHNSYHVETAGNQGPEWHYTHAPLDVQARDQGVRSFELDTHYNSEDGRFEVYHIGVADEGTTCKLFTDCLSTLATWSKANPRHHLLFVMIEPKDKPPVADPEAWFQELESEILSAWPREKILTPDDVQGDAATLRDAVTTKGWPTLGDTRGKILFFVNDTDKFRTPYTHDNKDLKGRLMFAESSPTDPFGAVLILNDPVGDAAAIESGAKAGFLVRTFSDGAGDIDTNVRDAALASAAHAISSDFPEPVDGDTYSLQIPGGTPSRCNPVTAPAKCTSNDIENPAGLR